MDNGKNLNGKNLNGKNLNGKNLNGSSLGSTVLWTSFDQVRAQGRILDGAGLDGSELVGQRGHRRVRGRQMVGAHFQALSDTGTPLTLRIRRVDVPSGPGQPWHYWVQYRETDGSWQPICLDLDTRRTLPATAIAGYWNQDQGVPGGGDKIEEPGKFTFACAEVGAIGKCIDAGYQPWSEVSGVSLDSYHQACVRTIRADYCGDGTSYTSDGQVVNIYDGLGVQIDTEAWQIEGEWDPAGARCVAQDSRATGMVPCFDDLAADDCGDPAHLASGALIISETPPD